MSEKDIIAYFDPKVWGDLYGATAGRPTAHRGLDIKQGIKPTRILRGGTVVKVQYSKILGWVYVVQVGTNDFDGYSHQIFDRNKVKVGLKVKTGDTISRSAGWDDDHGSAWRGPHLHLTNSP